jgi:hypothetical protein
MVQEKDVDPTGSVVKDVPKLTSPQGQNRERITAA